MVTTLIVNASPLISLGKIDGLRLLASPLFKVYVPGPVADEVLIQANDDAAQWFGFRSAQVMNDFPCLQVDDVETCCFGIGREAGGESSVGTD